jgi:hypothetical protein
MTHLDALEQKQATEAARVKELQEFWCASFPTAEWMPADRRFFWWVRSYDQRTLKYAITTAATSLSHSYSPERLGKYVSAVARNVTQECAERVSVIVAI